MAKNAIVYQSRNRLTGTLTQTIDTKHKDSEKETGLKFISGKRYAARCVEHKAVIRFDEHYPAGRAIAHVDEWCKRCIAMVAKGIKVVNKKAMKTGPATAADNRPDLRMSNSNNAFDKRWRNGSTKRTPRAEKQRTTDQVGSQTKEHTAAVVSADATLEV